MKKVKIIAGITWAILCLIVIIILFPGLNSFSNSAAKLPFMKINPNYTGGDISQRIIEANCTIDIRKPVFAGLFRERQKGFVQVDWRGKIADKFSDTIDYNADKIPDFVITVDRTSLKTTFLTLNPKVNDLAISTPTSYGWAVRVNLGK